jgi:hypothetical protein
VHGFGAQEQERLALQEQERHAQQERERLEQERFAQRERERLKRERLAQLEKLERERLEQEILAQQEPAGLSNFCFCHESKFVPHFFAMLKPTGRSERSSIERLKSTSK